MHNSGCVRHRWKTCIPGDVWGEHGGERGSSSQVRLHRYEGESGLGGDSESSPQKVVGKREGEGSPEPTYPVLKGRRDMARHPSPPRHSHCPFSDPADFPAGGTLPRGCACKVLSLTFNSGKCFRWSHRVIVPSGEVGTLIIRIS